MTLPASAEDERQRKHDEADDDVRCVQADQRVKGSSEEIGVKGEAVVVDEVVPLLRRGGEEDAAQQDRRGQPECAAARMPVAQRVTAKWTVMLLESRQMVEKMGISSTSRGRWAGEALADVIEVGDDKDDEDGRLGNDEAGHAHDAARGQRPALRLADAGLTAAVLISVLLSHS